MPHVIGPARGAGIVSLLAVEAALLAGCAAGSSSGAASGDRGLGIGATAFRPGTGPMAPKVTGSLLGGKKFSLASYHGHVVVLNFWGSWCSVCRQEAPELSALASQFTASGVRFLGVDVADNSASAQAYMRHFRISFPSLSDPDDKIALDFRGTVPIADFPSTLVLAASGRVTGRIIGAVTYDELDTMIRKTEAEPGTG
jgi:peroxiredoxin